MAFIFLFSFPFQSSLWWNVLCSPHRSITFHTTHNKLFDTQSQISWKTASSEYNINIRDRFEERLIWWRIGSTKGSNLEKKILGSFISLQLIPWFALSSQSLNEKRLFCSRNRWLSWSNRLRKTLSSVLSSYHRTIVTAEKLRRRKRIELISLEEKELKYQGELIKRVKERW